MVVPDMRIRLVCGFLGQAPGLNKDRHKSHERGIYSHLPNNYLTKFAQQLRHNDRRFQDHLEAILGPTLTYITAEEINSRIKSILGMLNRDVNPYDGDDLPSADAAREIDAVVQMYTAMGDTAEWPVVALTPSDTPRAVHSAAVGE
jgi:hypothetical protein